MCMHVALCTSISRRPTLCSCPARARCPRAGPWTAAHWQTCTSSRTSCLSTWGSRKSSGPGTSSSTGRLARQQQWPLRSGLARSTRRRTFSAVASCSLSCSASPCPSCAALTIWRPSGTGTPGPLPPGQPCPRPQSSPSASAAGCCWTGPAGPPPPSACGPPSCRNQPLPATATWRQSRSTCCGSSLTRPSGACSIGAWR
mmetsp:Transcript_22731/g.65525  ORF Transcript_22731/g.65525 Transcript_22731/m.65525 type:complete len:200 (+) Transcript_22731:869-1468(+)